MGFLPHHWEEFDTRATIHYRTGVFCGDEKDENKTGNIAL